MKRLERSCGTRDVSSSSYVGPGARIGFEITGCGPSRERDPDRRILAEVAVCGDSTFEKGPLSRRRPRNGYVDSGCSCVSCVRLRGGPARVPACAVFPAGHEGVCIRLGGTVAHSPSGRDMGLRRVRVARRSGGRAPSRWFPAVAPVPGWCVAAPVESVRRPTEAGRTRRGCVEGEPAWVWIGSVSRPRTRAGRWR